MEGRVGIREGTTEMELRAQAVVHRLFIHKTAPGAIAPSPGREAALAWASLAQRFPASSVLGREGAGCGSQCMKVKSESEK